jgi:hypothetical protein
MKNLWKLTLMMGITLMFSSCSHSIDYYNDTTPKADIKEFFEECGEIDRIFMPTNDNRVHF